MVELVAELEKIQQPELLATILAEAKAGEYHDYKNTKYACGKVALVTALRLASEEAPNILVAKKLELLAKDVIDGDYDEDADEDDVANLRREIDESVSDPVKAAGMKKMLGL